MQGEAFGLQVAVTSDLLKASIDGSVQQLPLPGLDGSLDLDVSSVGQLAAWLGIGQVVVHGPHERLGRMLGLRVEGYDLTPGVDACVCSSRALDPDAFPCQIFDSFFDFLLYREGVGLELEPMVGSPLVLNY